MSRLDEKETIALSSLHDISDYSNYIDQRISKLNNLYHSLTITREKHPSHRKNQFARRPSLTRQPPHNLLNNLIQKTQEIRERQQVSPDQMYRTEYLPRRDRYQQLDDKQRIYAELKSLTLSNFRNNLDSSRKRFSRLQEKKPADKRLQVYKQIKNDMLGTFYVGGRTLSHHARDTITSKLQQQQAIAEQQPRGKRGRLWHGRPPVKIIEKYD